jgi:hypothetical protein
MFAAAMGWIGTVGTIGAYLMLSRGHWHSTSVRYGLLNMLGGVLGAGGSAAYGAWPSVASNLIWSGVALQSVLVTLRSRRSVRTLSVVPEPEPPSVQPVPAAQRVPHHVAQRMFLTAA